MGGAKKPDWPQTPGGTTDWEVVFEDSQSGLIPMILQAKTAHALRESTLVVIRQLYTRKDDPPEVERFTRELDGLIPDDTPSTSLPKVSEGVTAILRQIKTERIRKAEEFERSKGTVLEGRKEKEDRRERSKRSKPANAGTRDKNGQKKAKRGKRR